MSLLWTKRLALKSASLFLCLLLLGVGCKSGDETTKEIKPVETNGVETELQMSRQAGDLLSVQERIREQPGDKALRSQLLSLSVNATLGTARAIGIGKVPATAQNRAAELQNVERAAFLDGCRWLVYVRAWQKDVNTPDFGRIQGNMSSARIVYKHTSPDQVLVMVETDSQ